jgi:WD40 repeat protein
MAMAAASSPLAAQTTFHLTAPVAGSSFYPSDSIPIGWSGNVENHLVRIEMRRDGGGWMPLRHFVKDSSVFVAAHPLSPGTYELQAIRTRQDTSWIQLGPTGLCWYGFSDITYSPDGTLVAVVACDGSVRVWDVASRSAVRTFALADSGNAQYTRVRFSADGLMLLASAAVWPRRVSALFDMTTGARLWSDTAAIVDMSADGSLLAVRNRVLRRADTSVVAVLGDSLRVPAELVLSPDGRLAASIDGAGVLLWSVESGRLLRGFYPHWARLIYGVEFSPDGALIAAATGNGTLSVWELASGRYLFNAPGAGALDASFSADGSRIATPTLTRGDITLWDSHSGEQLGAWGAAAAWRAVALSPDDTHVAAIDPNGTIRVFRLEERLDTVIGPRWQREPARIEVSFSDSSFGRVLVGGLMTGGFGFTSRESIDIPLDSMWLGGPDSTSFTMFTAPPKMIRPGRSDVEIHFRPIRSGFHQCAATAIADGITTTRTATAIAARRPVVRDIFEFGFGQVPWKEKRDTVVTFVRNIDSISHEVTVALIKSNTSLISYSSGLGTKTLAPGDSLTIAMRFVADSGNGLYRHEVHASFDDVGSPVSVVISAAIVGAPYSGVALPGSSVAEPAVLTVLRAGEGLIDVRVEPATNHAIDLILYNARGEASHLGTVTERRSFFVDAPPAGLYFIVARDRLTGVAVIRPFPL